MESIFLSVVALLFVLAVTSSIRPNRRHIMPEDSNDRLPAIAQPQRRLVMKRRQTMSFSTALFYLQSKPEVDDEYRRIVESILDGLIVHTGLGGRDLGEIEIGPATE